MWYVPNQPGKMIWEENRRAENSVEVERLPREGCFCPLDFAGEHDVGGKQACLFQQGIPMEARSRRQTPLQTEMPSSCSSLIVIPQSDSSNAIGAHALSNDWVFTDGSSAPSLLLEVIYVLLEPLLFRHFFSAVALGWFFVFFLSFSLSSTYSYLINTHPYSPKCLRSVPKT